MDEKGSDFNKFLHHPRLLPLRVKAILIIVIAQENVSCIFVKHPVS